MKEHPLREVDLDQIGSFEGNDVTIVDVNGVAGMKPVCDLLSVFLSQHPGALTESRSDLREGVAVGGD